MSDIVLMYCKTGMDIGSTCAPPHNLLCVAAPLVKVGYKVKIIDQRVNHDWGFDLLNELGTHPIFVGISAMTGTQTKFAMDCAKIIRQFKDSIPIVWGGAHPTLLPQQVLDTGLADYVCQREVDETIVQIAQDIANHKAGKIINSPLPDVEKLLPEPYELLDIEQYIHPDIYVKNSPRTMDCGQTSRGCSFRCGFCSSASIRERRWRAMSSEKAIDMIKDNVKRFNLTGFWLRDDEFYISQQRAAQISEGILPLNMRWYTSGTRVDVFNKTPDEQVALYRRSGAHTLKFGAESGNNRILKLMNKGITREETLEVNRKAKRNGIVPAFALMCGFPTETFEEMDDTISLARELRKTNPQAQLETMAVYTALPATPMWELAVENGLKPPTKLEEWCDWNFDEYDPDGKRIPWFNLRERQAIGNLCYLSMLSNAAPNVIDSLTNKSLKYFMKVAYPIPHKYFQWRFFNAHYKYTGELKVIHELRKRVFYSGHNIIR
jgi:radical SAM superfamily enzyme YgiQ (UPF0313 family)